MLPKSLCSDVAVLVQLPLHPAGNVCLLEDKCPLVPGLVPATSMGQQGLAPGQYWCKSVLLCIGRLGPGECFCFSVNCCCQSCPLSGPEPPSSLPHHGPVQPTSSSILPTPPPSNHLCGLTCSGGHPSTCQCMGGH